MCKSAAVAGGSTCSCITPFSLLHLHANMCGYSLKGKAVRAEGSHNG